MVLPFDLGNGEAFVPLLQGGRPPSFFPPFFKGDDRHLLLVRGWVSSPRGMVSSPNLKPFHHPIPTSVVIHIGNFYIITQFECKRSVLRVRQKNHEPKSDRNNTSRRLCCIVLL